MVAQDDLILGVAERNRNEQRVAFTNGCFDLLHPGHIRTLEEARACGDLLVVAINSDSSVRQIKGDTRPLVPEAERAEILAALAAVDYVVIFDAPTPHELIARLRPDVLVKGGDWGPNEIVEDHHVVHRSEGREDLRSLSFGNQRPGVPLDLPHARVAIDGYDEQVPAGASLLQSPDVAGMQEIKTPVGECHPLPVAFSLGHAENEFVLRNHLPQMWRSLSSASRPALFGARRERLVSVYNATRLAP